MLPYLSPFRRNHCVVNAWVCALHGPDATAEQAAELAKHATRAGILTVAGVSPRTKLREPMWAELAGGRIVRAVSHSRFIMGEGYRKLRHWPTLGRFVRERCRSGRWIVYTHGHAVAVVDGVVYGSHSQRAIVQRYLVVVPASDALAAVAK